MSQTQAAGSGRMVLVMIAGLPLTIMLAASWLWYFVIQGDLDLVGTIGTANNGKLIQPPRQVEAVAFQNDVGAQVAWSDLEPRWTLVVANSGTTCDDECERRLYFTRQVHIALGKEFNRVRRVYLSDTPMADVAITPQAADAPSDRLAAEDRLVAEKVSDFLEREHRGVVALSSKPEDFRTLFPELESVDGQWFLVDPAGWVMMRYPDALDYKLVIKDLKFLLKNSGGA